MSRNNINNDTINNLNEINNKSNNENDSSFNQLLTLQLLIQKHSGLQELCM